VRASTDRSLAASRHLTVVVLQPGGGTTLREDDRSHLVMSSLDPLTELILDAARSVD
jgi:hypothetical protein